MLHKSKAELVALANQLADDGLRELVAEIGQTTDWFKNLHELLLAAECRIMCAYAAGRLGMKNAMMLWGGPPDLVRRMDAPPSCAPYSP
jgi:hypothetical protein